MSDYISGRIWEYLWQVVFTGQNEHCPNQHICYCDGYGVCFEGEEEYEKWFELKYQREELDAQLKEWTGKADTIAAFRAEGVLDEAAAVEVPELGRDVELLSRIRELDNNMKERREKALTRGNDPQIRALESGREWHDGDGF